MKHGVKVKASLAQRKEPLRNEYIRTLLSLWYDLDNVAETATVRAIWQLYGNYC